MSLLTELGEIISDNFGWVILGACVLVAFFTLWAVQDDQQKERAFMAECQQHRAHYECVAMWRAGDTQTQIVPVFVPAH
jgi:hypothetical protein